MIRRCIFIVLFALTIQFGCDQVQNQRVIVVTPDEVNTVKVRCYLVLGVPSMCAFVDETTKTVRIKDVVTNIIERIVKQQVIIEVPVEKIVKQIETQYIEVAQEVDIDEIVVSIIERIKQYVDSNNIIEVPTEVIVDETTDYISDAPRPENNPDVPFVSTPVGDIKSEDDKMTEDSSTPKDDNTTNDGTTNEDTTDGEQPTDQVPPINNEDEKLDLGDDNIVVDENPDLIPAPTNNPPVFTEGESTTRRVLEGTSSNVAIGLPVSATDADEDTLEYTLGGTNESSFSIESDSGQLRTKDPLDYETKNSYSVVVTVSDPKDGKDEIVVTILVTDENEPPIFTDGASTSRSIAENTPQNEAIGDPVAATDINNDTLEYALVGTDSGSFAIDSSSGQLKTSDPLNYEVKNAYAVSVIVSDNKGGTDQIDVTITITDANDAPVFTDGTSASRSVAENLPAGTVVGAPVSATDEDEDTLTYTIGGDDASKFNINDETGQITTKTVFNHEDEDTYSVELTVSDSNGGTDQIDVTITITDANDAPIFTEGTSTTRSVDENLSLGTVVGTPVTATDEDEDTLTYTIGGDDASKFNINDETGQITTKMVFNHEDEDTYSVELTVSDSNGGTDQIDVTITITDANDRPTFGGGFFVTRSVAENMPIGSNVGVPVTATDEDNDMLEYGLSGPNAASFSIDSSSAQITTKEVFNHEDRATYNVTVSVSDGKGGTNGVFVTINITDVNEAPIFTEGEKALRAIIESAAIGTNVGHAVLATDEDGDTLTYAISGTDASSFDLDTDTGQLSTKSTLDYDNQASYSVTVSVTDNNGGTDSIAVEIDVLEFYLEKEEFFEVYYAIKLDDNDLEVQTYVIRGYGYDGDDPIYVNNYYKFEDGSSDQTSTGWSSVLEESAISDHVAIWNADYSEDKGYTHATTRVSLKETTEDAARKAIYQTICNAAHDIGTWTSSTRGVTFPDIDNNDSSGILTVEDLLLYLDDDDCNPNN